MPLHRFKLMRKLLALVETSSVEAMMNDSLARQVHVIRHFVLDEGIVPADKSNPQTMIIATKPKEGVRVQRVTSRLPRTGMPFLHFSFLENNENVTPAQINAIAREVVCAPTPANLLMPVVMVADKWYSNPNQMKEWCQHGLELDDVF